MEMSATPNQPEKIERGSAPVSQPSNTPADFTPLSMPSLRETLLNTEPTKSTLAPKTSPEIDSRGSGTADALYGLGQKLSDFGATVMAGGISLSGVLLYLYWASSVNPASIIREAADPAAASSQNFGTLVVITLVGAVPLAVGGAISLAGAGMRKLASWFE